MSKHSYQTLKPLFWVGSSKDDYGEFPPKIQDQFGFELFLVQTGQFPRSAKPLKGFGSGVLELAEQYAGGAYRAVYSVHFKEAVYVLHAFQKKSTRGISTAKRDIDLRQAAIERRRGASFRMVKKGMTMVKKPKVVMGSENIFADLGLPDSQTHFVKAQIVSEIYRLTNERCLTQGQAGERMGITQPEVSRMFKGNFREYSIERLMAFLTAFDRDVEIVARPHKRSGKNGKITFVAAPR